MAPVKIQLLSCLRNEVVSIQCTSIRIHNSNRAFILCMSYYFDG